MKIKKIICLLFLAVFMVALILSFKKLDALTNKVNIASKPTQDPGPQKTPFSFDDNNLAREAAQIESNQKIMNDLNVEMNVYGQVLDQNETPIAGVELKVSRYVVEGYQKPGQLVAAIRESTIITDDFGKFSLLKLNGTHVSVSPQKQGYEAYVKDKSRSFYFYGNARQIYQPNSEMPAILRMWKLQGAEKLVERRKRIPIRFDGTPIQFDLMKGTSDGEADLAISVIRDPILIKAGQRNFDWSITLNCKNGLILEKSDIPMYLAPVEGYEKSIIVKMPPNNPPEMDNVKLNLYLKLKNGANYGRANIELNMGRDNESTYVTIESYVNESGSRNLE